MLDALVSDTRWQGDPEGTISYPCDKGFCWIIVNARPRSLVIALGAFGFAVGPLCDRCFANPSLADALRGLSCSAGLMSGYRGRYLHYCLRVAAGERTNGPPQPTEAEQELLDEEESTARSRLRYQLGRAWRDQGVPSESVMLARAKQAIAAGADVNAVVDTETGNTRLHEASRLGRWAVVRYLLLKRADPNVVDLAGETPLHLAVRTGSRAIASLLLVARADANAKTAQDARPFHIAAGLARGAAGMVDTLLNAGASGG